jgi:hypothetical protein
MYISLWLKIKLKFIIKNNNKMLELLLFCSLLILLQWDWVFNWLFNIICVFLFILIIIIIGVKFVRRLELNRMVHFGFMEPSDYY